jgi:predicted enzyme related to lactoylglutathione lyase
VNDEKGGYAEFKAGDMKLGLFNRQEMAEMIDNDHLPLHTECQDGVALVFVVPDLEEAYQQLKQKEAKFITPPMTKPYYGIKTAYLRDPDGTLIGLYQPLF